MSGLPLFSVLGWLIGGRRLREHNMLEGHLPRGMYHQAYRRRIFIDLMTSDRKLRRPERVRNEGSAGELPTQSHVSPSIHRVRR